MKRLKLVLAGGNFPLFFDISSKGSSIYKIIHGPITKENGEKDGRHPDKNNKVKIDIDSRVIDIMEGKLSVSTEHYEQARELLFGKIGEDIERDILNRRVGGILSYLAGNRARGAGRDIEFKIIESSTSVKYIDGFKFLSPSNKSVNQSPMYSRFDSKESASSFIKFAERNGILKNAMDVYGKEYDGNLMQIIEEYQNYEKLDTDTSPRIIELIERCTKEGYFKPGSNDKRVNLDNYGDDKPFKKLELALLNSSITKPMIALIKRKVSINGEVNPDGDILYSKLGFLIIEEFFKFMDSSKDTEWPKSFLPNMVNNTRNLTNTSAFSKYIARPGGSNNYSPSTYSSKGSDTPIRHARCDLYITVEIEDDLADLISKLSTTAQYGMGGVVKARSSNI